MLDDLHIAAKEHYLAELRRVERNGVPEWAKSIRLKSIEQFGRQQFPDAKSELWQLTDLSPILERRFHLAANHTMVNEDLAASRLFNDPEWVELVFIDGVFSRNLSVQRKLPPNAYANALGHMKRINPLRRHFDKHANQSDAFLSLNTASFQDGAFVYAPPNQEMPFAVHILSYSTGKEPNLALFPRNLIIAGMNSHLKVVETHVGPKNGPEHFADAVTEIVVEENAQIDFGKHIEQSGGYHVSTTHVSQRKNSRFNSSCVTTAGRIVRSAINLTFEGEHAECRLDGLYLNPGSQLVDHTLAVDHSSPECRSRITYKGIVAGDGRAVYRGGVNVHQHAQQTDSNQVNRNLLLSDRARVDTTPKLEIYADDVRCTHGATVGSPPEDILFYFRTRGISESEAKNMLTIGFAREIIDRIDAKPWRNRLQQYVEQDFFNEVKKSANGNHEPNSD